MDSSFSFTPLRSTLSAPFPWSDGGMGICLPVSAVIDQRGIGQVQEGLNVLGFTFFLSQTPLEETIAMSSKVEVSRKEMPDIAHTGAVDS